MSYSDNNGHIVIHGYTQIRQSRILYVRKMLGEIVGSLGGILNEKSQSIHLI